MSSGGLFASLDSAAPIAPLPLLSTAPPSSLSSSNSDWIQMTELLKLDKQYLSKELESVRDRCRIAEAERDRLTGRVTELERHRESLVDKIFHAREENLTAIRTQQSDSHDQLKRERDEAVSAKSEMQGKYDGLAEEHRAMELALERERLHASAAIAARTFEFERLSSTFDETLVQFKALKAEFGITVKKNRVIISEYDALKNERDATVKQLQHQLSDARDKLAVYQQLEHDLDLAILNAGSTAQGEMDAPLTLSQLGSSRSQVTGIDRILGTVSSSLPVANRRRLQQSIMLAQQLVEKHKQLERSDAALIQAQRRCDELQARLTSAQTELDALSQPQHYLITSLRSKDEQLAASRHRLSTLELTLDQRESECQQLRSVNAEMARDLERLTQQRQAMRQLKSTLITKRKQILEQRDERLHRTTQPQPPPTTPKPSSSEEKQSDEPQSVSPSLSVAELEL